MAEAVSGWQPSWHLLVVCAARWHLASWLLLVVSGTLASGQWNQLTLASGQCSQLTLASGQCSQVTLAGGQCSQVTLAGGQWGQVTLACGLCSQLTLASGLCSQLTLASGLCSQLTLARGLAASWHLPVVCAASWHLPVLCSQLTPAGGLCSQLTPAGGLCSQLTPAGGGLCSQLTPAGGLCSHPADPDSQLYISLIIPKLSLAVVCFGFGLVLVPLLPTRQPIAEDRGWLTPTRIHTYTFCLTRFHFHRFMLGMAQGWQHQIVLCLCQHPKLYSYSTCMYTQHLNQRQSFHLFTYTSFFTHTMLTSILTGKKMTVDSALGERGEYTVV